MVVSLFCFSIEIKIMFMRLIKKIVIRLIDVVKDIIVICLNKLFVRNFVDVFVMILFFIYVVRKLCIVLIVNL